MQVDLKMYKHFHMQASYACSLNIYATEVFLTLGIKSELL